MNPKITTEEEARIGYDQWKAELYQHQETMRLKLLGAMTIAPAGCSVSWGLYEMPAQQLHQAERQASKNTNFYSRLGERPNSSAMELGEAFHSAMESQLTEAEALAQRIYDSMSRPEEPHNGGGTVYFNPPRLQGFEVHEQYLIRRHPMLWVSGDQRVIHIKKMSNSHLGNILRAWPRDGAMTHVRKHNEAALIAEAQARGIDRRDDWFRPESRGGPESGELPPSHGWDRAKRLMSDLPGTYKLKILNNRLVQHKDAECLEYLLQNEDGQLRLWRARIDSINLRRFQVAAGMSAGWVEGASVIVHLRNSQSRPSFKLTHFEKVST